MVKRGFVKSVFDFKDYKSFLLALNQDGGFSITQLAEAAGCQRSYLSRVINGPLHLTPDQCFLLTSFLHLNESEAQHLHSLLEYDRASAHAYRQTIADRIKRERTKHLELKSQVRGQIPMANHEVNHHWQTYYSSWLYAALHIAVSVPALQTLESLAARFRLDEAMLESYLAQLQVMGLVEHKDKRWKWKSGDIHLPKENPLTVQSHQNWILKAQENIQLRDPQSIHYSVVQSLSADDYDELLRVITKWINDFNKKTGPSRPEEVACLHLDFFKVR